MRILMLAWKDVTNPAAGGAEAVTWELLKSLAQKGFQVSFFTSRYNLSQPNREKVSGIEVYRAGGRFGVYFWAFLYYFRYFRGRVDLVIDQINTLPFFTPLFVGEKKIAYIHQLAGPLWFYETRFPFSFLGYFLEPLFLFFYKGVTTVTGSPSTIKELVRLGFKKVSLVPYFISVPPLPILTAKPPGFNLAYLGRLVPGKRPLEALFAFAEVHLSLPESRLFVVGRGTVSYQKLFRRHLERLNLESVVSFRPHASNEERNEILRNCHLLLVPSIKEGWGLVVTEANSQGTPAVVYNVDGLRDSVRHRQTGLICAQNSPHTMAKLCLELYFDPDFYQKLREEAWRDSQKYNLETAVNAFIKILEKAD